MESEKKSISVFRLGYILLHGVTVSSYIIYIYICMCTCYEGLGSSGVLRIKYNWILQLISKDLFKHLNIRTVEDQTV